MTKKPKIFYLIPPSEGKNYTHEFRKERVSFPFEKPLDLAKNVTPKDLKCKDKRYEEAMKLNANILNMGTHIAISRYDGVMYKAIDYEGMNEEAKKYFEKHFLILSGMYGLLKPHDKIANYKLPIETPGLVAFWKEKITHTLQNLDADIIVDLLPNSYKKMIDFSVLKSHIYEINFVETLSGKEVKISHGVKKIKGEFIKNLCENAGGFSFIHEEKKHANKHVFTLKI